MKNEKMKKSSPYVKLVLVILIFTALAVSVYAQAARPSAAGIAKLSFLGNWQYFVVNALIIFTVLFIVQAFILHGKQGKEMTIAWVLVLVISLVLSWFISSKGFIWQMGFFAKYAQYFKFKIIVNTIIISLALWFGLGLLDINFEKNKQKKVGLGLLVILISVMIAVNIGDQWLWDNETWLWFKDYLFGPKRIEEYEPIINTDTGQVTRGEPSYVEGILTLRKDSYRLIVFVASIVVLGWFFTTWIKLENQRLTWAIVILMAAALTRRGSPLVVVLFLLEAFLILIIVRNVNLGVSGGFGVFLNWAAALIIVEFIFCTVFGVSAIAATLSKAFSNIPLIGGIFKFGTGICGKVGLGGAAALGPKFGLGPIMPKLGPDTSPDYKGELPKDVLEQIKQIRSGEQAAPSDRGWGDWLTGSARAWLLWTPIVIGGILLAFGLTTVAAWVAGVPLVLWGVIWILSKLL